MKKAIGVIVVILVLVGLAIGLERITAPSKEAQAVLKEVRQANEAAERENDRLEARLEAQRREKAQRQ